MAHERYIIGVDIGGTKTAVSLGTVNGALIRKERFDTRGSAPEVLHGVITRISTLREARTIEAIGVSCGGPLNAAAGVVQSPPNLPGWDDIPVTTIIGGATGVVTYLENDANACALAEWYWGAGRGARNVIFLTFGTGLGAGIIADGRLYRGSSGLSGEIGHLRLATRGPLGTVSGDHGKGLQRRWDQQQLRRPHRPKAKRQGDLLPRSRGRSGRYRYR